MVYTQCAALVLCLPSPELSTDISQEELPTILFGDYLGLAMACVLAPGPTTGLRKLGHPSVFVPPPTVLIILFP